MYRKMLYKDRDSRTIERKSLVKFLFIRIDSSINSLTSYFMTLPTINSSTPKIRRHESGGYEEGNVVVSRILLLLACIWPLFVLGWFSSSGTSTLPTPNSVLTSTKQQLQHLKEHHFPELPIDWKNPGLSFRKYLDRVDIMGYGPTHPRVAVVLVADGNKSNNYRSDILHSIESVLKFTDRNRLFLICVVLDGDQLDEKDFINEVKALPQRIWQQQDDENEQFKSHGLRYEERQQQRPQQKYLAKLHVMTNPQKQGISASRADAIEFISLLSQKHEQAGIKSTEEDLLLLLLQPGSELISNEWLSHVTSALIVPPPIWGNAVEDVTVALQLANAVSFGVQPNPHQQMPSSATMAFDTLLRPKWVSASAKDMALSNGYSYPTPALAGAATALRLQTYLHLPAQDTSISDEWAANLELSFNLWLCADGIDVLSHVMVNRSIHDTTSQQDPSTQFLEPKDMARFAAAWMDISSAQQVFQALSSTIDPRIPRLSRSDWEAMILNAKRHRQFPTGLQAKCRSWKWFVQTVNPLFELQDNENHQIPSVSLLSRASTANEITKPKNVVVQRPDQQQHVTPLSKKDDPVTQKLVKKETMKPIPTVIQQQKLSTPSPTPKKEDPMIPKVVNKNTMKPIPSIVQKVITEPPMSKKEDPIIPQVITKETAKPILTVEQQQKVNSRPLTSVIEDKIGKQQEEIRKKPSRPLDSKRLEIIQKAPTVNISFVNMIKESMDFPHKGARDEHGHWGYVHDETALRKNPPSFNFPQLKEACDKRDNNYNMLTQQVFVDFQADEEAAKSGKPRAKIFCLVYTIESGHDRIPFIRETWG
jgi:hypothetical protein